MFSEMLLEIHALTLNVSFSNRKEGMSAIFRIQVSCHQYSDNFGFGFGFGLSAPIPKQIAKF